MAEEPRAPLPPAQHAPSASLEESFKGATLTDQYGKPFDPAQLKKGPVIVLFGYGDCPRCTTISRSVAAIQQKLLSEGKNVPIVVVSVQPEQDADKQRRIITGYYERGVRQFSLEGDMAQPLGEEFVQELQDARLAAYEQSRDMPQSSRLLHVLRPQSNAMSLEIQQRMGHVTQGEEKHAALITLFNDGKFVEHYTALPRVREGDKWRDIAPDEPETGDIGAQVIAHTKARLAPAISDKIKELAAQPPAQAHDTPAAVHTAPDNSTRHEQTAPRDVSPQEGLDGKTLWNFGLPIMAAIAGVAVSGGTLSFQSLAISLLAAGGVSMLTQWVTGKGIFAQPADAPAPGGSRTSPQTPAHQQQLHTSVDSPVQDFAKILQAGTKTARPVPAENGDVIMPIVPRLNDQIQIG